MVIIDNIRLQNNENKKADMFQNLLVPELHGTAAEQVDKTTKQRAKKQRSKERRKERKKGTRKEGKKGRDAEETTADGREIGQNIWPQMNNKTHLTTKE